MIASWKEGKSIGSEMNFRISPFILLYIILDRIEFNPREKQIYVFPKVSEESNS